MRPYHEFQRRGPQILPGWTSDGDGALHDHDGTILHETEFLSLRQTIIIRNDAVLLKKYLAKHPLWLGPGETPQDDPFWTAAAHGSTDCLDVMLQHWAANSSSILAPDARGFRLLHVACKHAQLATARFLLDEQGPWASRFGDAIERNAYCDTAILSAASSYRHSQRLKHGASEELMRLLLSKGARATDVVLPPDDAEPLQPLTMVVGLPGVNQPLKTVPSLAVRGASPDIIERLVDGGADIHAKTIYIDSGGLFGGTCDVVWDVTPLHIGSMFANANGIQALRERRGQGVEWTDMVSRRDSHGRLPLHWATETLGTGTQAAADDIIHTMEILLAENAADTISSPDTQGDTPLHYALRNSGVSLAPETSYQVAKFLCEKGARVNIRGKNGQTPLHCMLNDRPSSRMIALCNLFLINGAVSSEANAAGDTVLHLAARSPRHLETVRFFLDKAGTRSKEVAQDLLRAVNAQGNTPLHVAAAARSYFTITQSVEECIRSQDAMMTALTPERRAYDGHSVEYSLLDQPNEAGKTPKQLLEESRILWQQQQKQWQQQQEAQRRWTASMGRGRGRGRSPVPPSLPDSPW